MLYPNHARILTALLALGFTPLPAIIWRKPTNSPNKFMGSGMLPAGAYVTLEHEHILLLRKGPKREFTGDARKQLRRESAIFWEERNQWYSDVWFELRGSRQGLKRRGPAPPQRRLPVRARLPADQMFSVKGDTVVDPFLGTGTTLKSRGGRRAQQHRLRDRARVPHGRLLRPRRLGGRGQRAGRGAHRRPPALRGGVPPNRPGAAPSQRPARLPRGDRAGTGAAAGSRGAGDAARSRPGRGDLPAGCHGRAGWGVGTSAFGWAAFFVLKRLRVHGLNRSRQNTCSPDRVLLPFA